jgi:hypothetical protein
MLLGTRVADKFDGLGDGTGEHIIRAKFSHGVVYSHNSLGLLNNTGGRIGCGEQRAIMKIVSGLARSYFPAGLSREFIIADNFVSSCKRNLWDLDVGRTDSTPESVSEGQQSFIVERNYFTKRFSERSSGLSLQVEGERGVVRNNAFDLSGLSQTSSPRGVRVWNRAPVANPPVPTHAIRVYNNSCYEDVTTEGQGTCIDVQSMASNTVVLNNVMFDGGGGRAQGAAVLLVDAGVDTTTCSSCNLTTTTTPFVAQALATILDFRPAVPGALIDRGVTAAAAPVNFTQLGASWVQDGDGAGGAQVDIGAFEVLGGSGGASAPAPPVLLP